MKNRNAHLDFVQRLRILEDLPLGKTLASSYSSHSRLHARTPRGMDERYPSGSPHRDIILEDLIIGLPTVQEYGHTEFISNHPKSTSAHSLKSLRKVQMSLMKIEDDLEENCFVNKNKNQ